MMNPLKGMMKSIQVPSFNLHMPTSIVIQSVVHLKDVKSDGSINQEAFMAVLRIKFDEASEAYTDKIVADTPFRTLKELEETVVPMTIERYQAEIEDQKGALEAAKMVYGELSKGDQHNLKTLVSKVLDIDLEVNEMDLEMSRLEALDNIEDISKVDLSNISFLGKKPN